MNLIYEEILERSKSPFNFGELENPDIHFHDSNPLCGDEVELFVKVTENKIQEIKFKGVGCTISKASTDLLLDMIRGKTLEEAQELKNEEVITLLKIKLSPMRIKCALLGLVALKKGIKEYTNGISH